MTIKASIIISFYNNIDALELIFQSLSNQTEKNFEAIIADDGSRDTALTYIDERISTLPFPVKHVWQEDKGFRKTQALNKAILASESDYLIIIDGDCIPERHFIEDHLRYAKKGQCLSGRRVELPEKFSQQLVISRTPADYFEQHKWKMLLHYIVTRGKHKTKGRHIEKGFRFPGKLAQLLLVTNKSKPILGCNFSINKEDLIYINGFNTAYEAPGAGEDTDIEFRLRLAQIKIKTLNYLAVQLHIYHDELSRKSNNKTILNQVKSKNEFRTEHGLSETTYTPPRAASGYSPQQE